MSTETSVPCGDGQHTIRLVSGELELVDHPDLEAEQVLAALGGDKPNCIRVGEAWNRRAADIDLLMVLPRSDDDEVPVNWGDVAATRSPVRTSVALSGPAGPPMPAGLPASAPVRIREMQAVFQELRARQLDILMLLALGHEFQKRLVGTIVAGSGGETSPALAAALAGRAAPAIARWLDVDVDEVTVAVHKGSGWGSLFASSDAVWVALPVSWLSEVWARGLEITGGRFVVGVSSAGVVTVAAPGSET